jgi:hydroxymethylpyrimidine/phosphomethylpyrimidine kinase
VMRPSVLVFSGCDPSGGAGMQADIQAIAANGAHPLSVVTSLTVQDNNRVFAVHPVPALLVQQQTLALLNKFDIAAVKIGIVANRANAEAIAGMVQELKRQQPDLPIVFDPVLASGHGDALSVEDAIRVIAPLIEIATLITPNLPEAVALCGGDRRSATQAATLLQRGCPNVLIKGGHGATDQDVTNLWFMQGSTRSWTWPRLRGTYHGSGCTLTAAVAALLATGKSMEDALDQGQTFCQRALESSYAIGAGQRIPDRSAGVGACLVAEA